MSFFSFKPKNIKYILVELVNVNSNGSVTQLQNTPLDAIPEQLRVGEAVGFGPNGYELVRADPATRAEAGETGHLRLEVHRISGADDDAGADQAQPLNTYPTVCPVLPALSNESKIDRRAYALNISDWRQIEFVSRTLNSDIDKTLAGIGLIVENNEMEGGYAEHYMRDLIQSPMGPNPPAFGELMALFAENREEFDGIAIVGYRNMVEGGFAFRTGSLTEIYGYQTAGIIQALCVGGIGTYEYDSPEVQSIADFCADHDFCLIDWPASAKFEPETEDFFAFFDPPSSFEEVYQEAPL